MSEVGRNGVPKSDPGGGTETKSFGHVSETGRIPESLFSGKRKTDRYNAFDIDFRNSGNRLLIARVGQERSVWIPEKPGFEKKVKSRFTTGVERGGFPFSVVNH